MARKKPKAPPAPGRRSPPPKPKSTRKKTVTATKTKPRKVRTVQCGGCFKPGFRPKDMEQTETGKKICLKCWDALEPVEKKTIKVQREEAKSKLRWYVLQCEPGMDTAVRKALVRKVKIESMQALVGRVIIPRQWEELVIPVKGEVVAEGTASDARTCHLKAQIKIRELTGSTDEVDGTGRLGGYRYSVFQPRGKEPGKESNEWAYKVRTVPTQKESRVLQTKKYPGYLVVNLLWCPEVDKIIKGLKHCWGLLLRPVHIGHRLKVSKSKLTGLYRWIVKSPDGKTRIARGGPYVDKGRAVAEGEKAKADAEVVKPIELSSKEAAEQLIAQQVYNQLMKDRDTRERRHVVYRAKDHVVIHDNAHPFRDVEGEVVKVDKSDPKNPTVSVKVKLLGQSIEVTAFHYQVKLKM